MQQRNQKNRCAWCGDDPVYVKYHDNEWGKPCHDDRKLFEMLVLESFQAGLSWRTILYKRKNFKKAFKNFDPVKIARFTGKDFNRLMHDKGIIRNRLKIGAAIQNARSFLDVQKEFGSFSKYIWRFSPKKQKKIYSLKDMPVKTEESDALAEDFKLRGFKFLGSITCYANMQAIGMVNDHIKGCWKYKN